MMSRIGFVFERCWRGTLFQYERITDDIEERRENAAANGGGREMRLEAREAGEVGKGIARVALIAMVFSAFVLSIVAVVALSQHKQNHTAGSVSSIPGISATAVNGTNCWDLNEDGLCDLATEDTNSDGVCNVLDCRGAIGLNGSDATSSDDHIHAYTNLSMLTQESYGVVLEAVDTVSGEALFTVRSLEHEACVVVQTTTGSGLDPATDGTEMCQLATQGVINQRDGMPVAVQIASVPVATFSSGGTMHLAHASNADTGFRVEVSGGITNTQTYLKLIEDNADSANWGAGLLFAANGAIDNCLNNMLCLMTFDNSAGTTRGPALSIDRLTRTSFFSSGVGGTAINQVDVSGNMAVGSAVAGVTLAPPDGLLVQGAGVVQDALNVTGVVTVLGDGVVATILQGTGSIQSVLMGVDPGHGYGTLPADVFVFSNEAAADAGRDALMLKTDGNVYVRTKLMVGNYVGLNTDYDLHVQNHALFEGDVLISGDLHVDGTLLTVNATVQYHKEVEYHNITRHYDELQIIHESNDTGTQMDEGIFFKVHEGPAGHANSYMFFSEGTNETSGFERGCYLTYVGHPGTSLTPEAEENALQVICTGGDGVFHVATAWNRDTGNVEVHQQLQIRDRTHDTGYVIQAFDDIINGVTDYIADFKFDSTNGFKWVAQSSPTGRATGVSTTTDDFYLVRENVGVETIVFRVEHANGKTTFTEQSVHTGGIDVNGASDFSAGFLVSAGVATFTGESVHNGGIDCNGNIDVSGTSYFGLSARFNGDVSLVPRNPDIKFAIGMEDGEAAAQYHQSVGGGGNMLNNLGNGGELTPDWALQSGTHIQLVFLTDDRKIVEFYFQGVGDPTGDDFTQNAAMRYNFNSGAGMFQFDISSVTVLEITNTTATVSAALDVTGTLGVAGTATFTNQAVFTGGIDVNGAATFDNSISGATSFSSTGVFEVKHLSLPTVQYVSFDASATDIRFKFVGQHDPVLHFECDADNGDGKNKVFFLTTQRSTGRISFTDDVSAWDPILSIDPLDTHPTVFIGKGFHGTASSAGPANGVRVQGNIEGDAALTVAGVSTFTGQTIHNGGIDVNGAGAIDGILTVGGDDVTRTTLHASFFGKVEIGTDGTTEASTMLHVYGAAQIEGKSWFQADTWIGSGQMSDATADTDLAATSSEDDLVVKGDTHAGLTVLGGTSGSKSAIYMHDTDFDSTTNNAHAKIEYAPSTGILSMASIVHGGEAPTISIDPTYSFGLHMGDLSTVRIGVSAEQTVVQSNVLMLHHYQGYSGTMLLGIDEGSPGGSGSAGKDGRMPYIAMDAGDGDGAWMYYNGYTANAFPLFGDMGTAPSTVLPSGTTKVNYLHFVAATAATSGIANVDDEYETVMESTKIVSAGMESATGNWEFYKNVTVEESLQVDIDVTVGHDLTVSANVDVGGDLGVTGGTVITGTLDVTGDVTIVNGEYSGSWGAASDPKLKEIYDVSEAAAADLDNVADLTVFDYRISALDGTIDQSKPIQLGFNATQVKRRLPFAARSKMNTRGWRAPDGDVPVSYNRMDNSGLLAYYALAFRNARDRIVQLEADVVELKSYHGEAAFSPSSKEKELNPCFNKPNCRVVDKLTPVIPVSHLDLLDLGFAPTAKKTEQPEGTPPGYHTSDPRFKNILDTLAVGGAAADASTLDVIEYQFLDSDGLVDPLQIVRYGFNADQVKEVWPGAIGRFNNNKKASDGTVPEFRYGIMSESMQAHLALAIKDLYAQILVLNSAVGIVENKTAAVSAMEQRLDAVVQNVTYIASALETSVKPKLDAVKTEADATQVLAAGTEDEQETLLKPQLSAVMTEASRTQLDLAQATQELEQTERILERTEEELNKTALALQQETSELERADGLLQKDIGDTQRKLESTDDELEATKTLAMGTESDQETLVKPKLDQINVRVTPLTKTPGEISEAEYRVQRAEYAVCLLALVTLLLMAQNCLQGRRITKLQGLNAHDMEFADIRRPQQNLSGHAGGVREQAATNPAYGEQENAV